MKKLLIIIALLIVGPVWAGDSPCGIDEYEVGSFKVMCVKNPDGQSSICLKDEQWLCLYEMAKKQYVGEIRLFDLCEEHASMVEIKRQEFRREMSGLTEMRYFFSPDRCSDMHRLPILNRLLSEGWELQEPYRGEDKVYLMRRVK